MGALEGGTTPEQVSNPEPHSMILRGSRGPAAVRVDPSEPDSGSTLRLRITPSNDCATTSDYVTPVSTPTVLAGWLAALRPASGDCR